VIYYQQGLSLINEIPITPRRVLDIGSGPAPFAFAALRHGASDVIAVDRSLPALKAGAEICGRYGFPLTIRQQNLLKGALDVEGKFDLIIAAHCLDEIFPDTQQNNELWQKQFIDQLLQRLTPEGFLLIVDNSLPYANQRLLRLREQLVKEGVAVQAPCVWKGECPALQSKNSPCYAQRELEKPYLIREIQRAARINLSSLKMSYLILRSPGRAWPELDKPCHRVVSPPIESHYGERYYLCGTEGKKTLGSRLKKHPAESRAFEYLRRGELISIEGAAEQGPHLDIVEGTRIQVEAATGKPLSEKEEEQG
jgi:SAM-dependent methyltransferase